MNSPSTLVSLASCLLLQLFILLGDSVVVWRQAGFQSRPRTPGSRCLNQVG